MQNKTIKKTKQNKSMLNNEISRKWFYYALVNIAVLFIVYGIMLLWLNIYAYNSLKNTGADKLSTYADKLGGYGVEQFDKHFDGETNYEMLDATFSFAFFKTRADGTLEMKTNNVLIQNSAIRLDKSQVGSRKEKFGNDEYLTVVVKIGTSECYAKVFMPLDIVNANNNNFTVFMIVFAIIFVILSLGASIAIGYLEIRPIASTYERQKNFINDMSHEIRTPLAIIKANLENVMLYGDMRVEDVTEMVEESLAQVEHIGDMASGLLSIVRSSNVSTRASKGSVNGIISEIIDVYSDLSSMENKSLVASIDAVNFETDKEKFKQLLKILLDNAIKYTQDGGKIKVKFSKTEKGCRLQVSDNGIGVPDAELATIFQRFKRGSNTEGIEGTGLGLSIAETIVNNLGGIIYAKANTPRGLTVVVELAI